MQDTCVAFFTARYGKEKSVQGFYDALVDHAHNMAIYPDDYQIIETFLKGLPSFMRELMFKDGLSSKINTIDDFVAQAIKHETAKKTRLLQSYEYFLSHHHVNLEGSCPEQRHQKDHYQKGWCGLYEKAPRE